jgi:hypothetical protein
MEKGYGQQGLQAPEDLVRAFREDVGRYGSGGVKIAGTTALCLYMGLPQQVREWLYLWVLQKSWLGVDAIKPEEVFQQMMQFYAKRTGDVPIVGKVNYDESRIISIEPAEPVEGPTHRVARIVHPVTPPPKAPGKGKRAAEG